ncbi:sporulation protein [Nonomuraea sp. NPDC050404]|uniref:sporulation protein n=1 Tax=Nonomuraea sp. NPDC050404 TaxID=3155783 RepID=UPI003401A1E8
MEEFSRVQVSGPATLRRGAERVLEFQVEVPWETPISEIGGRRLSGLALGVRTEVAGGTALDRGDPVMVTVKPLPSQLRVLRAFAQLGFPFKSTALKEGRLNGARQDLPFYQEIEFYPPMHQAGPVHEVELVFVPDPDGLDVVLKADQHTDRGSSDAVGRFRMSHEEVLRTDWPSEVDRWLVGLLRHVRERQRRGAGR